MSITQQLQAILQARYGRDVRQAIHDSIEEGYNIAVQAEGKAVTAEDSASASASAAAQSSAIALQAAQLAEQYKNEAFSGTPTGYADLVAKVNSIYRQTATSYSIIGTSEGSALAHTIYGMSVQDGTPTPSVPVEIQSTKADFKCVGKNLINATLTSRTVNGLTVTKNQDGTYMISGTATDNVLLFLENAKSVAESGLTNGSDYRLCGCPSGGSLNTYFVVLYSYDENHNAISSYADIGSGTTRTLANSAVTIRPAISIKTGTTLNNVLFKPMLTIDLTATYDDFEPYKETAVTTDLTLRAIEVASTDDYNLVRDGKYYIADTVDWSEDEGYVITRRIKEITINSVANIGSLPRYGMISTSIIGPNEFKLPSSQNIRPNAVMTHFAPATIQEVIDNDGKFYFNPTSGGHVFIRNDNMTSLADWNTWVSENTVVFQGILVNPTTESITSEQAQALLSLKTYDEATSISATGDIEPSLDLEYSKDRSTALALTGHNLAHKNALKLNDINTALIELGGN